MLRKFEKKKQKRHFAVKSMSILYDTNTQLKKDMSHLIAHSEYAQIIGNLLHLMNFTQPNITYVVNRLSRYTHDPNKDHWTMLHRVMKYL